MTRRLSIRTKLEILLILPVILFGFFMGWMARDGYRIYQNTLVLERTREEAMAVADLQLALSQVVMPANDWIITESPRYKGMFDRLDREVEEAFRGISRVESDSKGRDVLRKVRFLYESIRDLSYEILYIAHPLGNPRAASMMEEIDWRRDAAIGMLNALHKTHREEVRGLMQRTRHLRREVYATGTIGGLAVLLLSLVFGSVYGRRLTRPILALKEHVAAIGKGDLTVSLPVSIHTGDEVEDLALGMDRMREMLKNTLESLDERVKNRTQELEENFLRLSDLTRMLERGKKEWENTCDAISDALFIHDREFRIIKVNRAYQAAAGIPFQEIIGRPYFEVFPKRDGPFPSCLKALEMQEEEEEEEEVFLPSTGQIFKVRVCPVKNASAEVDSLHVMQDVTEARRIEERIKEAAEISGALLGVTEVLAGVLDLDGLLSKVTEITPGFVRCDRAAVFLWDEKGRLFIPQSVHGIAPDLLPAFKALRCRPEEYPFFAEVLRTRRLVGIPDCLQNPLIGPEFAHRFQLRSLYLFPIIRHEMFLGTLNIGLSAIPRALSPKEISLVQGIAHQVAIAIENVRNYREIMEKTLTLSKHMETMEVMYEIDHRILSTLDQETIMEELIHQIPRLIPTDRLTLAIVDHDRASFRYSAGFGADSPKGREVPFSETNAAEVVFRRRAIVRPDLTLEPDLLPLDRHFFEMGFRSDMRIPLFGRDGTISAVLNFGSFRKAAFTADDLRVAERVAAQIAVALENAALVNGLQETLLSVTLSLASALEAKSPWTRGHSERVTEFALKIAEQAGLAAEEKETLRIGGLLHDIGKIGTYEALLDKPDRLTPEEFEQVKHHCMKGVEILGPIRKLEPVLPLIAHHHENFDGSGYPSGLKGEAIPKLARILAVADAYDSMTADRPYRAAPGKEYAVSELRRCSGTQFDPEVVAKFLDVLEPSN